MRMISVSPGIGRRAAVLAAVATFSASAGAQVEIHRVGFILGGAYSIPAACSNGGGTVVGHAYNANFTAGAAYAWTPGEGIRELLRPNPPPYSSVEAAAVSVSEDGSVAVGWATGWGISYAVRWTPSGGEILGPTSLTARAQMVSGDGRVVIGEYGGGLPRLLFRWTPEDGLTPFGPFSGLLARVGAVSRDGSVVTGSLGDLSTQNRVFRWTAEAGVVELPPIPGTNLQIADTAIDGLAVGSVEIAGVTRAFIWTPGGGLEALDVFGRPAAASCVSVDGSVVAGVYGSTSGVNRPFLWTRGGGAVDLTDVLTNAGLVLGDLVVKSEVSLSPDGRTIAGYLWRSRYSEGFSAAFTCHTDRTLDGVVDFADYSSFIADFETGAPAADFNTDGFIDFFDYSDFVAAFESGC